MLYFESGENVKKILYYFLFFIISILSLFSCTNQNSTIEPINLIISVNETQKSKLEVLVDSYNELYKGEYNITFDVSSNENLKNYKLYHNDLPGDIIAFDNFNEANELGSSYLIDLTVDDSVDYFQSNIINYLNDITNDNFIQANDLFDCTSNVDIYSSLSGILKSLALGLSKMSNDLRLLSSGPITGFQEINLPIRQNGSSIMPGKINPVIPEIINQIAFNVIGNDTTITCAVEAGQLELNAFLPIIATKLFDSLLTLTKGIKTLNENCCIGITANVEHLKNNVEHSAGISTALCPYIGYLKASEVAHEAVNKHETVREVVLEKHILPEDMISKILNPSSIACAHHLK